MQPKNESFMDSKTIIAIAISAVFFIGWQAYLGKKYPNMHDLPNEKAQQEKAQQEKSSVESDGLKNVVPPISADPSKDPSKIEVKPEEFTEVKEIS